MIKTTRIQICSSLCFFKFKPTLIYVAFLVPSLICTYFLSFGFSPFLVTIPVLLLATISLVTFTKKKKVVLVENPVQDDQNLTISLLEEKPQPVLETVTLTQPNAALQSEVGQVHEYQVESPDCPSESESSNDSISSENFDPSWMHSNYNVGQDGTIFDDSVSEDDDDEDEDSLIEIALPGSESMDMKEDQKQKQHSNFPDVLQESIFKQEGLMEVLAEINEVSEEDNLIEIDISMGSIKSARFEIEA